MRYIFKKGIPLFNNSNKERVEKKQFTLANGCLNLNGWFDPVEL